MKKLLFIAALILAALPVAAQPRTINAHWCALGTSITWYNNHVSDANGGFTKGYPTRVMEKLGFTNFTNQGVSGGALKTALPLVIKADYYTIEHGINDWGQSIPVGTMEDYINNTDNGTFAAEYRKLIDKIYTVNPKAKIVICTPRRGYGFNTGFGNYLPDHCYDPKNDIYLEEYAEMARQIADYESIPVADFYKYCGGQRTLLDESLNNARANTVGYRNDAVHPNDKGYQRMANVLIDALEMVLVD